MRSADGLSKYEEGMSKTFECKMKGRLGRGKDSLKEMRMLNWIEGVTDDELRYKTDSRHAELLAESLTPRTASP